jgi:hypothetical protein
MNDIALLKRNVALDLVLTILMCGLWNLVVQYEQIKTLNLIYREEKYNIWKLSGFTILTCGIYFIYFEYLKSVDFAKIHKSGKTDDSDAVIAVVLTIFGMNFIYDAILQTKINDYIDAQNPIIS